MAKSLEDIEYENSIREDQKYRDAVKQLQLDVASMLAMLQKITESTKSRNRFVLTTCVAVFVVLFSGVFAWVSTSNSNKTTHEQIYKDKADRQALNHSADWLRAVDAKIGLGYTVTYYDLVRVPPDRTRGEKKK